ncbi:MAG TPA: suppressor of fused domain protein [Ilumatobacteraceae bacterium]|nr:suppressor of fused domain protein [Ilumatobacteraceae bacterium]HRB05535.1 suppressor of fused domain protein [Ilumatobacteraceae bacterium]
MPDEERYTETDRTRIEMFLAHLDDVTGGIEPRFFPVATTHEGLNGVTAVVYSEVPEPGYIMAVTYGFSLASHPQWTVGTPELCICVESVDANWALAVAFIAEQMRGECPFVYGGMLDFGGPMSEESPMSSLVFFAPAVLEPADYLNIDVGDELPINIVGCYPIHETERQFIAEHGLEQFWEQDWDPFDVLRDPALGATASRSVES